MKIGKMLTPTKLIYPSRHGALEVENVCPKCQRLLVVGSLSEDYIGDLTFEYWECLLHGMVIPQYERLYISTNMVKVGN